MPTIVSHWWSNSFHEKQTKQRMAVLRGTLDIIVAEMDSDLPVSDVLTMNQLLGKQTFDQSFNATLLTAFATLSLLEPVGIRRLFHSLSYAVAPLAHAGHEREARESSGTP
jgi:hypothetical protein